LHGDKVHNSLLATLTLALTPLIFSSLSMWRSPYFSALLHICECGDGEEVRHFFCLLAALQQFQITSAVDQATQQIQSQTFPPDIQYGEVHSLSTTIKQIKKSKIGAPV
jgi:hypothetical protein